LAHVLKTLAINCVLDVGSFHGEFGSLLRKIGYRGRIASFEPVAENFQFLERQRTGDPEWRAFRLALGATRGSADIRVFVGTTFHSFLDPSRYGRDRFPEQLQVERTEHVAIERLDSVLGPAIEGIPNARIFLKVDTQGYDLEVIRGLGTSIDLVKALQIEMAVTPLYENMTNRFPGGMTQLQQLGFQPSGVFPVSFDSENGTRLIEFDCMVCRDFAAPRPHRRHSIGSVETAEKVS
jgi:FkbM family methyltransferase